MSNKHCIMEVEDMPKINCECGKMLARWDNGTLYLWCKSCKKEVAFRIPGNRQISAVLTPKKRPISSARQIK